MTKFACSRFITAVLLTLIAAQPASAQMRSRSLGSGPPPVLTGPSPAPGLSGASQAPIIFDLSGVTFSGSSPVNFAPASGGSGTGAFTYSSSTPTVCTVSGNSITPLLAGQACVVTATRSGSGVYGPTSTTTSVLVPVVPQDPLAFSLSGVSFSGSNPVTFAPASGGSGSGAITYATSTPTVCTVTGNSITPLAAGQTCMVTATRAGSGVYGPTSNTASLVIPLIAQDPLVFSLSGISFSGSNPVTFAPASGGSGSGAITYETSTPTVCTVTGNSITPLLAGQSCVVTATRSGSGVFGPVSKTASVSIPAVAQAPLTLAIPSLGFPGFVTLPSASGGSGVKAFTYTATGACSLSGTKLTANSAGACTVTVTNPANGIFGAASLPVSVTIAQSNMSNPCSAGVSVCDVASNISNSTGLSGVTVGTFTFKADPNVVTRACIAVTGGGRPLGAPVAVTSNATNTISGVIGDGAAYSGLNIRVVTNAACDNYPASGFAASTTVAGGWNSGVLIASGVNLVSTTINLSSTRACSSNNRTYTITASATNTSTTPSPAVTLAVSPASSNCTLSGNTLTISGDNSCSVVARSGPASQTATYQAALTAQTPEITMIEWAIPVTYGGILNHNYLNPVCSSRVAGTSWSGDRNTVSGCTQERQCLFWDATPPAQVKGLGHSMGVTTSSSSWYTSVLLACTRTPMVCNP